ncbi:hypothetical protein EW146_g5879 [Bondarzewia mesenterica]|uniref:Major facilitator superfamily (MFS) profile domain-containing protein n=1 Tax=Bondarzewia mesenterica TaxID=1095465 RepID=A0A4S4LQ55_9AGAM|nr:hypothetical protein EW146_g5879 [Bondarzewia mesenterica]
MSSTQDAEAFVAPIQSKARKFSLLALFCIAQFIDTFSISSLITAIPKISVELDLSASEAVWLLSGFMDFVQILTVSPMVMKSGRVSDVYSPKMVFVGGIGALGFISLGAGFLKTKIPLIVLRALGGIAGSMTIPSALALIVAMFPQPLEQSRAISLFGGCGALGNVAGLIIGGVFAQFATWHWVFWFVTIVAVPISFSCIFLIPAQPNKGHSRTQSLKRLDMIGVSILTIALVLLIYAVTSGSANGWGTGGVLAPLIISIFMVAGFFYYETLIPTEMAAVPPRTWFYPNFSALFGASLLPYFFWTTQSTLFTELWQGVYGRSAISAAVHTIPSSVVAFALNFTGPLQHVISPKWLIISGQLLMALAGILGTFADGANKYWRFDFLVFVFGSAGAQLIFTHDNVAIFRTTPPHMAGIVGAIFNGGLQLGSAVGLAVATSIQSSVSQKHGSPNDYSGRAAAYWFIFAAAIVSAIAMLFFYHTDQDTAPPSAGNTVTGEEHEKAAVGSVQSEKRDVESR